jgi:hypothetical protein
MMLWNLSQISLRTVQREIRIIKDFLNRKVISGTIFFHAHAMPLPLRVLLAARLFREWLTHQTFRLATMLDLGRAVFSI